GLDASGAGNGLIVLADNTFTDNLIGAWFGSGLIDLTGQNFFTNGQIALRFAPAPVFGEENNEQFQLFFEEGPVGYSDLKLVNDTIGQTVFEGQSLYYVELQNGAFFQPGTPTIIDGTEATYDGVSGGLMTLAQLLAIEAKIHDFD